MQDPVTSPEARIAALQAEVDLLRAEMQDFSYTVSHDLRASLRHIVSYAHLVQEDAGPLLNEEVQGFLATITDSAKHMGVLMDGLMELSRLGTVALQPETVSLQTLVADVSEGLSFSHPQRRIRWKVAHNLPEVQADAVLLRQVLTQVLDNAVKFTAGREEAVIEITRQSLAKPGMAVLQVQDNGAGYNPALQSKLFHAFQRLHGPKQFAGIGMGLALARKALQRMGGGISAQGAVDAGCCITLTLPSA